MKHLISVNRQVVLVLNFGIGFLKDTVSFDDEDGLFEVKSKTFLFPFIGYRVSKTYRTIS